MTTCDDCGKERTDEADYSPFQFIFPDTRVGWYSGDDGELCPPCLSRLFLTANGGFL